jgi:hypothetical protein
MTVADSFAALSRNGVPIACKKPAKQVAGWLNRCDFCYNLEGWKSRDRQGHPMWPARASNERLSRALRRDSQMLQGALAK